jgi:integrase
LSDSEIKKLIEVLDAEENQLNTYAIKLILLTGSRKTEVLSARWQDFNLKNNTWTKPASMTKQKKISHTISHL